MAWRPLINVTVHKAELWGVVNSASEKRAARVAAETTLGKYLSGRRQPDSLSDEIQNTNDVRQAVPQDPARGSAGESQPVHETRVIRMIEITGPRRRTPWRGVQTLVVAAIVVLICLIALAFAADFLVDWLWFSAIGYWGVFWTTIVAEAEVFFVVFMATTIVLWVNGVCRVPIRPVTVDAPFRRLRTAPHGRRDLPDVLEFLRHRLPWPAAITGAAGFLAVLVAWGEVHNWGILLRFIHQVPYGQSDPLYGKDIGFYLFSLPAYVALKNWMLVYARLERSSRRRGVLGARRHPLDSGQRDGCRPQPQPTAPSCWVSSSR